MTVCIFAQNIIFDKELVLKKLFFFFKFQVPFYNCKTEKLTVSENVGRVSIDVSRESFDSSSAFQVVYTAVESSENDVRSYLKHSKETDLVDSIGKMFRNVSKALANQDFEPVSQIVTFDAGEITKVI
jgi:hypothetical protein